jgi:S-adenosylmethionine:tRNA ribosyltransferase-isomerase
MWTDEYDYELPQSAIAQEPARERDGARLLAHEIDTDRTRHLVVRELPSLLEAGDLLVVNDTRVIPARLFARRSTGGQVEVFLLEANAGAWEGAKGEALADARAWTALVRPAKKPRAGEVAELGDGHAVRFVERLGDEGGAPGPEWRVELLPRAGADAVELLEACGRMPLPPYIRRDPEIEVVEDRERYQTVFAARDGAVAAPTAGLHFTPALLEELEAMGVGTARVTLHVGAGTFRPVTAERIEDHVMHAERYELSEATAARIEETRAAGGRVVAVGTTSVRVLESCVDGVGVVRSGAGETRLFLSPGSRMRVVDALLTNFHLPKSTLLMLVSAFAGRERTLRLYAEALAEGYRFYSYGDAMFLSGVPASAKGVG